MTGLSKRARKTMTAMVAVGALSGGVVLVPQVAVAVLSTARATTALNVRLSPSTSAQVLGVLAAGEQVERRGDPRGEWTPVRYRGQDAWVFSAYLSFGDLGSAPDGTATATEVVNVRSGASTLTPVLGVLRVGESIGVTGQANGGWVPVNYNGHAGYVYAAYLSFDSSTTTPPVSTPTEEPSAGSTEKPSDGSTATGSGTAKTALNVRSGPSANDRVIHILAAGERIDVRGEAQDGWVPVIWNGQDGWVASQYLTLNSQTTPETTPETEAPSDPETPASGSTAYTTSALNLRTGPGTSHQVVRVLPINTQVALTGVTQDGFSQVKDGDQLYWVSTIYLSDKRVSSDQGAVQGPAAPSPDGSTSLTFGGSSGLTQLRETTKQVVYAVRANYPQINTMYGYRQDPLPDHPSGRAVDIMMPNGANDVALGDSIAAYLQANANSLNIEYLIWRQRIWINGDSGWTWMADRGGTTANHYDHIHVTVYS